jgi:hypothetical protein
MMYARTAVRVWWIRCAEQISVGALGGQSIMSVLTTLCPHCGADPVPLTVRATWKRDSDQIAVAADCPKCTSPCTMILLPGPNRKATADWFGVPLPSNTPSVDILTSSGWEIFAIWPKPAQVAAPEFTPPDIARLYSQAHSAKNRGEREAAGFVFGKTVEVSIKAIAPNSKGSLAARIDELAQSGELSRDVQKWAHEVRIIRNDAVHEMTEPSAQDISEIAEFVEAFLTFVFTMPKKYEMRTSRKKDVS